MKKLIMSIIVATICIFLCACGETKQNFNSEDKILILQMKINIQEATIHLSDSNKAVIDSLYAMKVMDGETSLICFKKALELVKDAKTRIDDSIFSPNFISKELEELDRLYTELRDECNYEIEELEYGPGLPASYFINDEIDDLELLNQLRLSLEKMNYQGKITLEMGRYIAFDCGYYFSKIVDMKTNRQENYCII